MGTLTPVEEVRKRCDEGARANPSQLTSSSTSGATTGKVPDLTKRDQTTPKDPSNTTVDSSDGESCGPACAATVSVDTPTTHQTSSPSGETGGATSQNVKRPTSQDAVHAGEREPEVHHISGEPADRGQQLLEQLELPSGHLTAIQRTRLVELLQSYSDVFALDPSELGVTSVVQHSIHTGEHRPTRQPVRRMPFSLRPQVDKLVQEMLTQGVIEPSASPWASPVVLVRKKDGTMRFCVDYRRLNSITKLDEFPLPRIDDTLDVLAGAKYFTALDLASGYWQVAMEPAHQEKTAFITYSGLYEFRRMPFGLVNAPATFQRLMELVLSGLARNCCLVYLDDVLVMGSTLEEHNVNLMKVLERIRDAGLRLKPKKCTFAQESLVYLGHVVTAKGIQTDPLKLKAMRAYPVPTDVKSLRSFVGLASYYRRFVPGFAKVAAPLHALTKKDAPFVWGPECQAAFENLKRLLTSSPVLVFPDFTRGFILETDASGTGLGAVLAQEQADGSVRPIAYASRSLLKHELNYGITELEGLGVVWAVRHFRPYLYGHSCVVYTDHQALKSLLNTPQPSGKLARWGMALQELDLVIKHRSGKHNANADAFSRAPLSGVCDATGTPARVIANLSTEEEEDLATLQRKDEELKPIIEYLETGILPEEEGIAKRLVLTKSQFLVEDSVLYWIASDSTLRVVPPHDMRKRLFQEVHSGRFGAHLRDAKVHSALYKHYWWDGMRADIARWTRACLVCATHNLGRAVRPPLCPIPVAGPFDRVGVDVIQFPRSNSGNQYAVVFVDYLTKWPEVFAVPDQSTATIARLLVEEIVSRHGVPAEILSDRGRSFLSALMREVEMLLGIHKVNTSAYHPQTDGLVERYNRTLTAMLAKTVERDGRDWDKQLPYVLFAYRVCCHESTQESPFYMLYGRDPILPTPAVLNPKKTRMTLNLREYGIELHTRMSEAWELARKNVSRAQKRQKENYDQSCRPPHFQEGERVFLFKPSEKSGPTRKFARPFFGPYRIVDLESNTAKIRRIDRPREEPILVALERLRKCPPDLADNYWPPDKRRGGARKRRSVAETTETAPDTDTLVEVNQNTTAMPDVQGEPRGVSTSQQPTGADALDRDREPESTISLPAPLAPSTEIPMAETAVNTTDGMDASGVDVNSEDPAQTADSDNGATSGLPVPPSLPEEGSRDSKSVTQGQPLKKWKGRLRRRPRDSRT